MIKIFLTQSKKQMSWLNRGLALLLVLRGKLVCSVSDTRFQLSENQILVINHRDFCSFSGEEPNLILMLHLSEEYLAQYCPEMLTRRYELPAENGEETGKGSLEMVKEKLAKAAFLYYKKEEQGNYLLQAELFSVFYILNTQFVSGEAETRYPAETGRLYPAVSYIQQNFKKPLRLKELAEKTFLSTAYFARLFRSKMGMSCQEYINSLRMEAAVQDLQYASEPITQVALQNGFSSPKVFYQQFKKEFGQTPYRYRREHHKELGQGSPGEGGGEGLTAAPDSLDELARFINRHEEMSGSGECEEYVIPVTYRGAVKISYPERILNIGKLSYVRQADVRRQIDKAQKNIGFDYACFDDFFPEEELAEDKAMLGLFQKLEGLNDLREWSLQPWISLRLPKGADKNAFIKRMQRQLLELVIHFPDAFVEKWHFELYFGTDVEWMLDAAEALKEVCPEFSVGVHLEGEELPFGEKSTLIHNQIMLFVDFVTFHADPNLETVSWNSPEYERYHAAFHLGRVRRLQERLMENGLSLPVYLTDWNTLTGFSKAEAGEFHRSALLVDTLLSLASRLAGISVALNLSCVDNPVPELISYPLSLYLYKGIKRGLFFTLRALSLLGSHYCWNREHILVTGSKGGEFAVLVFYPCYIRPFQSLENLHGAARKRTAEITLTGLPKGTYQIKSLLSDKDNGSLYHTWTQMNFSSPLDDEDIVEYLENFCNPTITLTTENIEDSYCLSLTLTMNAMMLYQFRRI